MRAEWPYSWQSYWPGRATIGCCGGIIDCIVDRATNSGMLVTAPPVAPAAEQAAFQS